MCFDFAQHERGRGNAKAMISLPFVYAVAGAVFAYLRLRSGSLLAPALAHLATNDISFVVGWLFNRYG